jgi:ketosteroid isomerase-like protein
MSQENVEIAGRAVDALQRGDWEACMEVYDPEIELDTSRIPDGGVYKGRDQVWAFWARWFGAWDNPRRDLERIIDAGDSVVVLTRMSGRGRTTGAEVSLRAADVQTFRDGKVIRHVSYPDAAEALNALGLEG